MAENTTQGESRSDSADQQVQFKQKKCLSTRVARTAAVLVGISLVAVAVLSAYAAGAFDSNPDLPEIMEGEATFTADDGKGEVFHVMIDYKRKLIQLTSLNGLTASPQLSGRRLMSFEENNTANGTRINETKIVIQDYNAKRKYFIIPEHGDSTTKCIYTDLQGDMIPRHLLKHATFKSKTVEGNMTHVLFQVGNDTVDVYRAKGRKGKIYEIYMHLPNGSIHMRSKEKELNFTDYTQLNCYRYIEENGTIEQSFYQTNDSKFYQESTGSADPKTEKEVQEATSKLAKLMHQKTSFKIDDLADLMSMTSRRRRRGIGKRPGGELDWWYGNWCGPSQGGYTEYPKKYCKDKDCRTTNYTHVSPACRKCLPPKDGLDDACMEHDRCIIHHGGPLHWCHPIGNPCICDTRFIWRVFNWMLRWCQSWDCRFNALQIFWAFYRRFSCWFPICIWFPWFRLVCACMRWWCPCWFVIEWICIHFWICGYCGSGIIWP